MMMASAIQMRTMICRLVTAPRQAAGGQRTNEREGVFGLDIQEDEADDDVDGDENRLVDGEHRSGVEGGDAVATDLADVERDDEIFW